MPTKKQQKENDFFTFLLLAIAFIIIYSPFRKVFAV